MHVCMYACMYACMYVYIYICAHVCIRVRVYKYVYMYVEKLRICICNTLALSTPALVVAQLSGSSSELCIPTYHFYHGDKESFRMRPGYQQGFPRATTSIGWEPAIGRPTFLGNLVPE